MKYTNAEYAFSRLRNTYIWDEGSVKKVVHLDGYRLELMDKKGKVTKKSIKNIDLTPLTLGYVNQKENCLYLSRKPLRRDWRQGLRSYQISCPRKFNTIGKFSRDYFSMFDVEQCSLNTYPSLSTAVSNVQDGYSSCAFHKDFCVDEDRRVIYKGVEKIGLLDKKDTNLIRLNKKFSHLRESLQEASNEIRIN